MPQSTACFAEAARLDPTNPRWPYLIGTNGLRFAPDEAVPHLRTALSLSGTLEQKSAARLQLADALMDRNELEEAAKLFNEELAGDPNSPRAHYGLGVMAANGGDYEGAVRHLAFAKQHPFSRQKTGALLAVCYFQLRKTAEAEACESETRRLPEDPPWPDPFDPGVFSLQTGLPVLRNKALRLESQGRYPESLATLQEMAQQYPDEPVLVRMGCAQVNKRDYVGAEKTLREALAGDPDNVTARCYLGIVLYSQAEPKWHRNDREAARKLLEVALIELRKAVQLKPDLGLAYIHIAYALKYLGRLPEALEAARAAIAARPQASISHVSLAEVLVDMGKTEEAIPHLETALKLSQPGDNRARTVLEKARKNK
jgi:tetratricopeptide (TPR) repeat protein